VSTDPWKGVREAQVDNTNRFEIDSTLIGDSSKERRAFVGERILGEGST